MGAGAPLLGVVANGLKSGRRGSYGYGYSYDYAAGVRGVSRRGRGVERRLGVRRARAYLTELSSAGALRWAALCDVEVMNAALTRGRMPVTVVEVVSDRAFHPMRGLDCLLCPYSMYRSVGMPR
jgi:hypothetical protein